MSVFKVQNGRSLGGLIEAVESGDVSRALQELESLLNDDADTPLPVSVVFCILYIRF